MVQAPDGAVRWRDRHFWPCVGWLANEGIEEYTIAPAERDQSDPVLLRVNTRNP